MLNAPGIACVELFKMSRLGRMMEVRLNELSFLSYHHHHLIVPRDVIILYKSMTFLDAATYEERRAYD